MKYSSEKNKIRTIYENVEESKNDINQLNRISIRVDASLIMKKIVITKILTGQLLPTPIIAEGGGNMG